MPKRSSPRRNIRLVWLLYPLLGVLIMAADPAPDPTERCAPNRHCRGCGCAGGPGYRAPDGHCVGFRELAVKCGSPPTQHCTFENAPGTSEHAECAMRPRHRSQPLAPAAPDKP